MNTRAISLKSLVHNLRSFRGITRKSSLGDILLIFGDNSYDDAGALDVDGIKIVVSTDGIVEDLVRSNPWLAGFYSVLVNVNDVVAKGARPLGYVNVISSNSAKIREKIARGIKYGLDKYRLQLLKGHTHPDTSFDAVDGAVVGVAKKLLSSTAAEVGDHLVVAVDLDGRFGVKGWVRNYDSVMDKSSEEVLSRLEAVIQVAEGGLANAARDVSGPGFIGTLAMLCESSGVGAEVDLEAIPRPEDLELFEWLVTYPAIGFVVSTNKPMECLRVFEEHDLAAKVVGRVIEDRIIWLSYKGQREIFMNFDDDSVFGLRGRRSPA